MAVPRPFGRASVGVAFLVAVAVAWSLAACGGGGGGGASESARANLSATYRPDTQQATLSWTDTFTNESSFRIDRQSGTDWIAVQNVPAAPGSSTILSWTVPVSGETTFRVLALVGGSTVALSTVTHAGQVAVATQVGAPVISLSAPEPLQGGATLTVSGAPSGATVRYYADFATLGSMLTVPPFQQLWDTTTASNGNHLLQAMVQLSADNTIEVRRQVTVGNPSPVPGLQTTMTVTPSLSETVVAIAATTDVGIASVQLFVDGQSAGTLALPNVCIQSSACGPPRPPLWVYSFTLPYAGYSNGQHAIVGVATDNNGAKSQTSATMQMNDPPQVTLARPADNEIVGTGSLQVNGAVSDDTGFADVSVTLGATQIQLFGAGSFNFSYDLTGLANGYYTLAVSARDQQGAVKLVQRQVQVQAGGAFQPQLVAGLGPGNRLVAAEGESALIVGDPNTGSVPPGTETRSRILTGAAATGVSTVFLDNALLTNHGDWRFSSRRALNSGIGDDSSAFNIYLWDADGSRRNLSKEAGVTDFAQVDPMIDGDWVAWSVGNLPSQYMLMNVVTRQSIVVPAPAGKPYVGNGGTAVLSRGSSALLCFWANDAGSTINDTTYGVYTFDSSTGVAQRLSPQNVRDIYVQTDGQRIAWQRLQQGSVTAPFSIVVATLSQPLVNQVLSSNASQFILRDGLLAWQEQTVTSNE